MERRKYIIVDILGNWRMKKLCVSLFILMTALIMPLASASGGLARVKVIYPAPEYWADERHSDVIEILRTALEKTENKYGPFEIEPYSTVMNYGRVTSSLKRGKFVNVAWGSTSIKKEKELLPIRIPLRKGLLGYRLMLTTLSGQKKLSKVSNVEEFKDVRLAQGLGWGDVGVLSHAGLNVVTANYENIFKMLQRERIDAFPRGVSEVFDELEINWEDYPNIIVEQDVLIKYPWPYYFFLNKNDVELAERIEAGLRIMIKDGSFDEIFEKYNRADLERANLSGRRVIELDNPLLPAETPLSDERLWFNP